MREAAVLSCMDDNARKDPTQPPHNLAPSSSCYTTYRHLHRCRPPPPDLDGSIRMPVEDEVNSSDLGTWQRGGPSGDLASSSATPRAPQVKGFLWIWE
ncbi:hypothetical protein E2562_022676 [Oryza meyeriana var. granulata]|uniref:Uncharacterized protein n=1 Tax=Oryza meyeriana var. granulata TaxID=110450 RepID=A0A6G1E0I5_9ORYZ|nr:hypothetical protein E2562_022676 [Oryza meyeriana var. granulata]